MSDAQTCGSYRYRWTSILFLLVSVSLELQPVGNRLLDTVRLFQTSYDGPIHGNGIRLTRIVSDRKLPFAYASTWRANTRPPIFVHMCMYRALLNATVSVEFRSSITESCWSTELITSAFREFVEVWELYLTRTWWSWFIRFLIQTIEVHVQTCCLIISSTFFFH